MIPDFDWSPWLEDGEVVVWSAKPSMVPLWLMGIIAITIVVGVALGVHDGSAKARLAVSIAPWFGGFIAIIMFASLFVRNRYFATYRRILTVHFAQWRRTPKLSAVSFQDAEVQIAPRRPTIVRSRKTRKQILSMNLSKKDEATLFELVKEKQK